MKRFFLFLILIIPLALFAQQRKVSYFNLRYGFLKGGESTLVVADTVYKGQKVYYYSLDYRTSGMYDKIFSIYDVYESFVDPATMLPVKSIRNIREQNYRYYNEVEYFRDRDSILTSKTGWQKAPKNLVDPLSVFFYFTEKHSLANLREGETTTLPLLEGDNIHNINITYCGVDVFETENGPAECYVFSSVVDKGKRQKRKDELKFYISKKDKVPVYFEMALKAGVIKASPRKNK